MTDVSQLPDFVRCLFGVAAFGGFLLLLSVLCLLAEIKERKP